jgi:cell division protein FtsB
MHIYPQKNKIKKNKKQKIKNKKQKNKNKKISQIREIFFIHHIQKHTIFISRFR